MTMDVLMDVIGANEENAGYFKKYFIY